MGALISRAAGLRLYAAFDLALTHKNEFILADLKAGKKTEEALIKVRKQLASYCLWALDQKKSPRILLRIQPYFLQPGRQWIPSPVRKEEFFDLIDEIEAHVFTETQLANVRAVPYDYMAEAEDFPPEPRKSMCANCKFLTVSNEGNKAVER